MTWLWAAIYLLGMSLGAWLALGAAADTRRASTARGRVEVGLAGALLWPVVVGYLLAGLVMIARDVLWRGR